LAKLKPLVEDMAEEAWKGFEVKHPLRPRRIAKVGLIMLDSRGDGAPR
jgi:hypothetical protein